MKFTLIAISLFSLTAFAETTTLTVEGMHCSGCKQMISKNVCDNESIKASTDKCEVSLVSAKNQIGEVKLTPKNDSKIDMALVNKQISAAGEDYKVTKEVTK